MEFCPGRKITKIDGAITKVKSSTMEGSTMNKKEAGHNPVCVLIPWKCLNYITVGCIWNGIGCLKFVVSFCRRIKGGEGGQREVAMLSNGWKSLNDFTLQCEQERNNEQKMSNLGLSSLLFVLIAIGVWLRERRACWCPTKAEEFWNVLGRWQVCIFSEKMTSLYCGRR